MEKLFLIILLFIACAFCYIFGVMNCYMQKPMVGFLYYKAIEMAEHDLRGLSENYMEKEYFCLVQDNDCHWYVIPVRNQKAWEDFCAIPEDDERSWDVPDWAERVSGSYSLVVFSDYEIK